MEKKKKKQTAQRNPNTSSQQKTKMNFGTSGLQISEDEASHLVGRIVEKGISDEPPTKPYLPPNPTVLPFPVARHRSHGPHWAPVGSKASVGCGDDRDEDGGLSDEVDKAFMDVDPIAPFANPVERRKKKGVDFSNWRELVAGEKSAMAEKLEGNVIRSSAKTEKREKDRQPIETVSESEDSEASSFAKMELDYSNNDYLLEILKKRETNYSASTVVSPGTDSGHKQETMPLESEIDAENRARLQGMLAEEIAEAQAEILEKMDPALLRLLKKRGQEKLEKQKSLARMLSPMPKAIMDGKRM